MTLLSLLDISSWGLFEWLLYGGLAAAVAAYYFWPEAKTSAEAEVTVDEATRKKAQPLIAVARDGIDEQPFTLEPMPLLIRVGETLKAKVAAHEPLDAAQIREALWVQQRAMITRLESELDYAQQADVTDHFAIAAPANQPGTLLEKTLQELESTLVQIRKLLKIDADCRLWHGRAMVLMLSTRKLFDHVAWLTGAGLAHSAPGAFTLCGDDVVMITIYATRLGGFTRPLTHQVCRAAIRGFAGERAPMWLEYGLSQWMADQMLGKKPIPQPPAPDPTKKQKAPPVEKEPEWEEASKAIFDPMAWSKASDDSTRLEQLVVWSGLYVNAVKSKKPTAFIDELAELSKADDARSQALVQAMAAEPMPLPAAG